MHIHSPEISVRDGVLTYQAAVEYEGNVTDLPRVLWFKMPPAQEKYLSPYCDALVANLLWVGLLRGEALRVRGAVSAKLAEGIAEFQRAVCAWDAKLKPARLEADHFATAPQNVPSGVGLSFSGGVDSFFSLYSHTAPRETFPTHRITHGVFSIGIDIGHDQAATIRTCIEAYGAMFASMGMELLTVESNIRAFYPDVGWGWVCYPHLAGLGLLFGMLFRRFYMGSGETFRASSHYTRLALLDHLFSTETLDIVHDGLGFAKVAKVEAIAAWEPVREHLRVCYTKANGLENCCRCGKCLHTMVCLDIAGQRENISTFPLPYTRHQLRTELVPTDIFSILVETRRRALERGRADIAFDLSVLMALSSAVEPFRLPARKLRSLLSLFHSPW
jgi:hypothetical protein